MPSKSHRAASRQAKLRQKKRRGGAAAQVFQAGPTESSVASEEPTELAAETAPETTSRAVVKAPIGRVRRSKRGASEETLPRHPYLSAELRRIGVISMAILVILAAVSFYLRFVG